jgi:hypothetical protein
MLTSAVAITILPGRRPVPRNSNFTTTIVVVLAVLAAAVAVAVVVVVVVVVVRTWETRLLMERRATCRCPGRLKHSNVYTSESKTYPRQKCGDEVVMYTKYTV